MQQIENAGRPATTSNNPARVFLPQDMMNALIAMWRRESGQDIVEYAIVLALIALAAGVAISGFTTAVATAFTSVGTHLTMYSS